MESYEDVYDDEYSEIFGEEEEDTHCPRFTVENDGSAEWVAKKIAENNSDYAAEKSRLEGQMKWYQDELQKLQEKHDRTNEYWNGLLHDYFTKVPHKVTTSGQERYRTPHLELVLKPQEPEYNISDSALLTTWLGLNEITEKFLKPQPPKADWAGLKKCCTVAECEAEDPVTGETVKGYSVIFKDTGEIIQGVSVVPREPKFVVTVKGGDLL